MILLFSVCFTSTTHAADGNAADLFRKHSRDIFQIRLIDLAAEKKSSLGSGFLVDASGVIATNYHVIESAITHPDKYRIEYLDHQGNKGTLTLLDVDVTHDLALLQSDALASQPLQLAKQMPAQGDTIFSIGNPYDIGFTVVPGTYNGIGEHSYYQRIHFSGSINAGMSGGPTLDAQGQVVGINVSSAGNQVSFLVPVKALAQLLNQWRERGHGITDFNKRIGEQLLANQDAMYQGILSRQWPTQPLGEATIMARVPPFVKCWGGSSKEDEDLRYSEISSTCQGDERIYLSPSFTSGTINYQFFWVESKKLNSWQFYTLYERLFSNFQSDNTAGKKDVGDFVCDELFIADNEQANSKEKAVLCIRAYKKYDDLFDALFLAGSVHSNSKAFIRHFSLAGVSQENTQAFLKKFMATAAWRQ